MASMTTVGRPPRVTVGVPFHNEGRWLADAIRSVLRQTMTDFELLLVDDGSTDDSLEIARSFTDPRIVVYSDGVRRRLPARLNEIVRRARGELVARMDADDVSHPARLERELALFGRNRCDAVGTWAMLVDAEERPLGVLEAAPLPATLAVALERGIFPHATMVARRSWLVEHPYDETLTRAEDRDLWCRTVASSSFLVLPEVLYVVRVNARGASFLSDYLLSQRQYREILRRYGVEAVGRRRTARTWLVSLAKSASMRVAVRAGLTGPILRSRGRAPTATERSMAELALLGARAHRA
jgi:glycosyltransferase involved in cell wall biosynthesis